MFNTERRGQVGIGTLIVFISMVLVAAIAAGVLINTAGLLQAQAQQTGEQTTAEVSDAVQVGKITGLETNAVFAESAINKETFNEAADNNDITTLPTAEPEIDGVEDNKIVQFEAQVRLASGSDAVNLSQATYTISAGGNATVINGNNRDDGRLNGDKIDFERKKSIEAGSDVLEEQSDLMIVEFDLRYTKDIEPIDADSEIEIIAKSPAGGESSVEAKTPIKINKGESYIL